MRQKNLSKSTKNIRNFTDVIRCMNACSNEQLVTQKQMREFFSQVLQFNILSALALPIVLKAEFNFELICTLPSVFLSPGSCFKSAICHIQNSLENTPIALFSSRSRDGKIIHKKSLRVPFTLIFHSEVT